MGGEVINIDQGSGKILHRLILGLRGSEGANGGKRRPEWVRGSERGQDVLRRGLRGSEWVRGGPRRPAVIVPSERQRVEGCLVGKN